MKPTLMPGVNATKRHTVTADQLLSKAMPGLPAVFATPYLLGLMETAAALAIQPHLDPGEASVGVGFDFQHLAPTPEGAAVMASAVVTLVDGNKVTLQIEARDEVETIARGMHVRAVVDIERFKRRLERKLDSRG